MNTEVLFNLAIMLVYILIGFTLIKTKVGEESHAKTLSGILVYVLTPFMIVNAFLKMEYTKERLLDIGLFFLVSLVLQIIVMLIIFFIFHKKYNDAKYRILTVGSVMGNVGFFGMPLITSVFPGEPVVLCYSCAYVISMNLIVFTFGTYLITNDKKYVSFKNAILNPAILSLLVALPLFIFKVDFPDIVDDAIALPAKMVTPVCMIIIGMRLGASKFKNLVTRPFVYIVCLIKLVIYPLFAYLCVAFIPGLTDVFKISIFVISMTPSASIVCSLAELHRCEQELSMNVVLMATLMCVITIPLMLLIVG